MRQLKCDVVHIISIFVVVAAAAAAVDDDNDCVYIAAVIKCV